MITWNVASISHAVLCAIKIVTMCIPHAINRYSVYISDRYQHFTVSLNTPLFLGFHRRSCVFFPLGDPERSSHLLSTLSRAFFYYEGSTIKNLS